MYLLNIAVPMNLRTPSGEVAVVIKTHVDFDSRAKFLSVFVPPHRDWFDVCAFLCANTPELLTATGTSNVDLPPAQFVFGGIKVVNAPRVQITAYPLCESPIPEADIPFSRVTFFYSDNDANDEQLAALKATAQRYSIHIRWRGRPFAKEHALIEKPVAFISHDTRDKEKIARPLALSLQKKICPVWYDEFSLGVGDSLREKIEGGLQKCARCI
jgi:hypothetical protein